MKLHNIFFLLLTLKWTTLARPQDGLSAPTTCLNNDVFYNNTCMPLLYEGSCGGPRDWLIRNDNGKLQCEPMPCYDDMRYHRVLFNGTCVPLGFNEHCPVGMEVVALDNGQGECDCQEEYLVFWANNSHTTSHEGGCYSPFERGPCSEHQVLYIPPVQQGGSAECQNNPCDDYNHIPIEELPNGDLIFSVTGECERLGSSCGIYQQQRLYIDYDDMTVKCGPVFSSVMKHMESYAGRQPLKPFNRHQCRFGSRRRSAGQCQSAVAALIGG